MCLGAGELHHRMWLVGASRWILPSDVCCSDQSKHVLRSRVPKHPLKHCVHDLSVLGWILHCPSGFSCGRRPRYTSCLGAPLWLLLSWCEVHVGTWNGSMVSIYYGLESLVGYNSICI